MSIASRHSFYRNTVLAIGAVAVSVYAVMRYRYVRKRHLQAAADRKRMKAASELTEVTDIFYEIIETHSGSPSQTAALYDVRRDDTHLFLFAHGHPMYLPTSPQPLPSMPAPTMPIAPASDSNTLKDFETRLNDYWSARSLKRSFLFNGALAFLLASILRRDDKHADDNRPLSYGTERIASVSLSLGRFTWRKLRFTVVSELGRTRDQTYEGEAGLADIAEFGTAYTLDHFDRTGALPSTEDMSGDIVWYAEDVEFNSADDDVFITFVTANNKTYHLDLSAAQYGLHNGYTTTPTPPATYLTSVNTRSATDNLLRYTPPADAALNECAFSPAPTACIVSDEDFKANGGLIRQRFVGAERIIAYVQARCLLSNRLVDSEYIEMRNIIADALQRRGLTTKYLYKAKS